MIPYRLLVLALPRCARLLVTMIWWAFTSKEHYNFTYNLSALNQGHLSAFIAVVAGHTRQSIEGFLRELEDNTALREQLRRRASSGPDRHNSDFEPRYGRRAGWYALVRATKPRVIVETGIDRGLGTVVLAAALHRNAEEGFPGTLYATDIMPGCGHLLAEPFRQHVRVLINDSVTTLAAMDLQVDIFIHDSDHRAEYERAEYLAVAPRLHGESLVLSDNAQETTELMSFAESIGKSFLFFREQPESHWWPGEGIGAAFTPGTRTHFQSQRK